MAKTPTATPQPRDVEIANPVGPTAAPPGLEQLFQLPAAMLRGYAAMAGQMFEFGNARMRENIEQWNTIQDGGLLEKAFDEQRVYFEKATQQYLEQADRLVSLMVQTTMECWQPPQEESVPTRHRKPTGDESAKTAAKPR